MVIDLNGKRKDIPGCYEELTVKQFEAIVPELAKPLADRDYFKIFQVFTDTNFTDYHATSENEMTIWNAVRWTTEQPFTFSEDLPKVLKVNGRMLTIPKRITKLSIGQNIHLKQLLAETKYIDQNISGAVAIYLQPLYDEAPFDHDRAMEFKSDIESLPAWIVRPIGFFLLTSATLHGHQRANRWQRILSSLLRICRRILPVSQRYPGSSLLRT